MAIGGESWDGRTMDAASPVLGGFSRSSPLRENLNGVPGASAPFARTLTAAQSLR
jgi:hypothetical protein